MASNSSSPGVPRKSAKLDPNWRIQRGLHPQFPLFPHQSGRWAKKVRGRLIYFGKVADDPKGQGALNLWNEQKDDLLAGRTPRQKLDGFTIADLCNHFLTAKLHLRDAGEISPLTWDTYNRTCKRLVEQFGKHRLVIDLAADDFGALRNSIAAQWGPVALGNEIQRVRSVFKCGYEAGLLEHPVRFGPMFKRPQAKVMRLARAENGPKLFEAADIRKLLKAADPQMKAMILLAVNCGFGNGDVGTLPLSAVDLKGGWINYHRPKTGIQRRCALWPETVAALRVAIAKRPAAKMLEAAKLLFVTKYGKSWSKKSNDNPVSKEFRKLLDEAGHSKRGLNFYALRHTFRTIADEAKDQPAVNFIMGHADVSMAAAYRERIADDRLQAVAGYVRAWLFPADVEKQAGKAATGKAQATAPKRQKSSNRTETNHHSAAPMQRGRLLDSRN